MSYHMLGEADEAPSWCPNTGCSSAEYQAVFLDENEPVWCAQYCPEGWYARENECGKWCFEDVNVGDMSTPSGGGSAASSSQSSEKQEPNASDATFAPVTGALPDAKDEVTEQAATPTWVYLAAGGVAVLALAAFAVA